MLLSVAACEVAALAAGDKVRRVIAAALRPRHDVVDVGAGLAARGEAPRVQLSPAVSALPAVALEHGGTDAGPRSTSCGRCSHR